MRRQRIVHALAHPMTVAQLAGRARVSLKTASFVLWELRMEGLAVCLTPQLTKSRVYCLSEIGDFYRCPELRGSGPGPASHVDIELVPWDVYAASCTRHRKAVVTSLHGPLKPSQIARRARFLDPTIRMSANNVRDVVRALVELGVLEPVWRARKAHPAYQLTALGRTIQTLIFTAEGAR